MKRGVIFVLIVILVMGLYATPVYADDAGITPTSFFYWLDLIPEAVEKVVNSISPKWQEELYWNLLIERGAEARSVARQKGFISDEYKIAQGRYIDAVREYTQALVVQEKHRDVGDVGAQTRAITKLLHVLDSDNAERVNDMREQLQALFQLKTNARENVEESVKTGDSVTIDRSLSNLQKVRADYIKFVNHINSGRFTSTLASEGEEDYLYRALDEWSRFRDTGERKYPDEIDRTTQLHDARKEALQRVLAAGETSKNMMFALAQADGLTIPAFVFAEFEDKWSQLKDIIEIGQFENDQEFDAARKLGYEGRNALKKAADTLTVASRTKDEKEKPEKEKEKERSDPKQWPLLPPLRPLGITNLAQLGSSVSFTSPTHFTATVGKYFLYSFCRPAIDRWSDLCPASSTVPTGGKPPYHFQLGSGVGFPPFGLTLNLNGVLAGTPQKEGTSTFSVCAADLAGRSDCKTVTIIVASKPKTTRDRRDSFIPPTTPIPTIEYLPSDPGVGDCYQLFIQTCLPNCFAPGTVCQDSCTASAREYCGS